MTNPTTPYLDIPKMKWDDWEFHPTWLSERQHLLKGLIPGGEPVAQVWYGNKWLQRRGHPGYYILLFDVTLAQPKVVSQEKQEARRKAKETARQNRTCFVCGKTQKWKIKRTPKLCNACHDDQCEITQARAWLQENAVIVDTETTGLQEQIIQIAIVDVKTSEVLLDSFIKPDKPIDESLYTEDEDYEGYPMTRPTPFAINGISNEMVEDAPDFPTVYVQVEALLRDRLMLGYNVEFDDGRLRAMCRYHHLDTHRPQRKACVMEWYSTYHGEWHPRHKNFIHVSLDDACIEQQVRGKFQAHTALGDCLRTLELIRTIAGKKAPLDGLEPIHD